MSYQVLARKWRPRNFAEVIGQAHVLKALINALDSDRLHHAYLFTGTRGVGKTTLGRVFAKALNCEAGVSSKPCGICSSCREIDEGRFIDLIEVDAASRTKVDDTRDLLDNVQYAPTRARYKVYLIDEVHMFSNHSFNALLKTLEEPPPHVKFLLATTDPKKLPVTILSRCLQFNLTRLPSALLASHLATVLDAEAIAYESPALQMIAQAASGSVRDSLSLLDQAIAHGNGRIDNAEVVAMLGTVDQERVFKLLDALAAADAPELIARARELSVYVPDYAQVLAEMLSLLRRVAVAHALGPEAAAVEDEPLVLGLVERIAADECQLYYQIALNGRRDLAISPDTQVGFEMILLRMLAFRPDTPPEPASSSRSAVKPRPQETSPAPAQALSKAQPRPVRAVESSRPSEVPAADTSPVITETEAQIAVESVVESAAGQAKQSAPAMGVIADWNRTVEELPVTGLVRELARNSALVKCDSGVVNLVIAPQFERLAAPRYVESLQAALAVLLGGAVKVNVAVAADENLSTPSQQHLAALAERQRRAEAEIGNDPNVLALQQAFGATIEDVSAR